MENESERRVWTLEDERNYQSDTARRPVEVRPGGALPDAGERTDPTNVPAAPGVLAEPPETESEREARERLEFIQSADDTEIVAGGFSTTAYRRAAAVFDETDDELQLAEHWHFRCAEYERHGRF